MALRRTSCVFEFHVARGGATYGRARSSRARSDRHARWVVSVSHCCCKGLTLLRCHLLGSTSTRPLQ